jgi:site-specific DNA recombinase
MNVILYARFSPRPNAAECESIESQLTDLRRWAVAEGHKIRGEWSDAAVSGGDGWDDRPGMLDAVHASKKGDLFVVRALDRLFRDTAKATVFQAMLAQRGVTVISTTEPAANGDEMVAKLVRFVFLWIAEYNRELLRARTRAKMLEHQRNGRRMSKKPPYGWCVCPRDAKRIEPDGTEQLIVQQIIERAQAGEGLREIARWLADAGIKTREGTDWHHQQVQRVLKRG